MLNADALSSRDGRLLHRSDVAQLLACSEAEVDRLVTAHQLKSVGTPAGDHFQLQDVAEWISGAR
jgi:hypothetical protein